MAVNLARLADTLHTRKGRISTVPDLWLGFMGNLLRRRRGGYTETSGFSRPLMPTIPIRAGPDFHERYSHFAADDRPALNRFDTMGFTLWAGHFYPLHFADTGLGKPPNDDGALDDLASSVAEIANPMPR